MKIIDPRDGHGYRLINEKEFKSAIESVPTYEDIALINSQENIKKLEILQKIPAESVAFTNDYNSLDNLPDMSVLEEIEDSPKPVQSAAIHKALHDMNVTLQYTKELAESNADAAYTDSDYFGKKSFYGTTKFGALTINPVSSEKVEITSNSIVEVKANPLVLNTQVLFGDDYPFVSLEQFMEVFDDWTTRVVEVESWDERIKALESDMIEVKATIATLATKDDIADFVTHDEMEESIKEHIAFDVTDKVEEGSKALVTSGGVYDAINGLDLLDDLKEYRDILVYMAKKRKRIEYDTLHLICSKMPSLMAILMQVEVREINHSNELSEDDWYNLREIVDERVKLFAMLDRLNVVTEGGTPIQDLPLESGFEFTEREMHDLKELLEYKDVLFVLLSAGSNGLNKG